MAESLLQFKVRMISEEQSIQSSQREGGVTMVFGLYFCNACKNMLTPVNANGHILQFKCHICGPINVDFSYRNINECLLYNKELQIGSKKYEADHAYVFDPTMPRVQARCSNCGHNEAVYFLTPDVGENKIIARMMCTRFIQNSTNMQVKCGYIWDLGENAFLGKTMVTNDEVKQDVIDQEMKEQLQFLKYLGEDRQESEEEGEENKEGNKKRNEDDDEEQQL